MLSVLPLRYSRRTIQLTVVRVFGIVSDTNASFAQTIFAPYMIDLMKKWVSEPPVRCISVLNGSTPRR